MDQTLRNGKSSVSHQQQQHNLHVLSQLMKVEGNDVCVDCSARRPRWASVNLGVFICMKCSGIHRSLGVHISKVRSCTLDTWLPEQIELIQRVGNTRANAFWEANLPPGFRRPEDNIDELQSFIRAKYERRRYASGDDPVSRLTSSTQSFTSAPHIPPSLVAKSNLASEKETGGGKGIFSDLQVHVRSSPVAHSRDSNVDLSRVVPRETSTISETFLNQTHTNSTSDQNDLFSSLRDIEERVPPVSVSGFNDNFIDPSSGNIFEQADSVSRNGTSGSMQMPNRVDSIMERFNDPGKPDHSSASYPTFVSTGNPMGPGTYSGQASGANLGPISISGGRYTTAAQQLGRDNPNDFVNGLGHSTSAPHSAVAGNSSFRHSGALSGGGVPPAPRAQPVFSKPDPFKNLL